MKGSSIWIAILAFAGIFARRAEGEVITAQEKISMLDPGDFFIPLGGPEPSGPMADGSEVRAATLATFPALEGQGVAMAIVNLEACSINLPHVHPRATEMSYVLEGAVRLGFVEENGGDGAVINDLVQGDVTFFPMGLIHFQQNLECDPAILIASFNSEDPGTVTITDRFFELPPEAIQASLNFDIPEILDLIAALPEAPIEARQECLTRCRLIGT